MLLFRPNSRSVITGPGLWRLYGYMMYMYRYGSERNTFFLEIFVPDAKIEFTETFVDKECIQIILVYSNYTVGRSRNRKRANLGLLRQGWQRVIEMRTKATACAIHNSLRVQHQTKVRQAHHDDGAGSFHRLKIITTTIAPVSMFNHHFSRKRG